MSLFTTSKDNAQIEQRQQLLQDLYSDSESTVCIQKSKVSLTKSVLCEDLEDGEIIEEDISKLEEKSMEVIEELRKVRKSKEKTAKDIKESVTRKRSPLVTKSSRKGVIDKKFVSKIVPGTVDDSACDLGEIIQKQTSLVQKDEVIAQKETETKSTELCLVKEFETEVLGDFNELDKEITQSNVIKQTLDPPEREVSPVRAVRLIELSDLVTSDETVSDGKKDSPSSLIGQRSIESIVAHNFGDQSNISLLIAADIFLQNENTMKSNEEKVNEEIDVEEMAPPKSTKTIETSTKLCNSPSETEFNGFTSQEIQTSPRNNSNDSLKENVCTPIINESHKVQHNHGATPKTMTKSEPKQLLTQLNNGPDSSIPTPDTSKDITGNSSKGDDSFNSSAKRKIIETKSTQYVVEETEDMVICTVNRKKRKKEKKEKKSKHKHKDKKRTSFEKEM